MPTRKKCRHCNTDNPDSALYCIACGKYLVSKKTNGIELQAMSGYGTSSSMSTTDNLDDTDSSLNTSCTSNSNYVVICPVCQYQAPTKKDVLPMSCSNCGYFFQVGLDLIVKKDSMKEKKTGKLLNANSTNPSQIKHQTIDSCSTPASVHRKSPMPTVNNDNSQLRLFWMNRINEMPIQIPQNGATLGSKGVLLKEIQGNTLFMIWHTPAGWYLRSINGIVLYNGAPLNLNIDTRLLNNDSIIIGNEQFRVEVI